jgi:hypothetical protein
MSSNKSKVSTPAIAEQKGKGKGGASSKTPAKQTAQVADAKGAEEQDTSEISFQGDDAPIDPTSPTAPAVSVAPLAPTLIAPTAPAVAAVDAPQTITPSPLDVAFATMFTLESTATAQSTVDVPTSGSVAPPCFRLLS